MFLDEERAFGILNLRDAPHGAEKLAPNGGHLFSVRRSGQELHLVGIHSLGISGHALSLGGGQIYASGDGGGFWRFDPKTFPGQGVERFGLRQAGVRRVVAVVWIGPRRILSGRDVDGGADRRTELGEWRKQGQKWSYTSIATGDRLRELLYAPERELLLLSARQSSASRGPAGSIWFVGEVRR